MTSGPQVSGQTVRCPKCALSLELAVFQPGSWVDCPACRSQLRVYAYPALENPPALVTTASGEKAIEGEAACFFHPEKAAAASCARCGRFLCALCDVPFGGRHLCPSCLDSSKLPELLTHRMIWEQMSMFVGVLPLIFFAIMGVLTGSAALFLAIWALRKPPSLVHGRRLGMLTVGIVTGLLQIIGQIVLIVGLAKFK